MRFGFTTGSCAAAASKAAIFMLLTGKTKNSIKIQTPKGIDFPAEILDIKKGKNWVSCSVVKDGGDDPDITTGAHIVSKVLILSENSDNNDLEITIAGADGVGTVTKPGLDQKVGEAAINKVPRQMIKKEVMEVCNLCDFRGKIRIEISVPEGKELAERTFNPRLGIEGGISILGTTGIVEPMSSKALLDTIELELKQKKQLGQNIIAISPGNYGQEFMLKEYSYDLEKSVKCSNFIGDSILMAIEQGFEKLLLTGHIGKLIKIYGGITNTHSKMGDCRMELLAAAAMRSSCSYEAVKEILNAVSTEEGLRIVKEAGKLEECMKEILGKIMYFLNKISSGKIEIACIVYCNQFGLLEKTENAESFLRELKNI